MAIKVNHTTNTIDLSTDGAVLLPAHSSAPPTPPSGKIVLYAKPAGYMYAKNDTGAETQLGLSNITNLAYGQTTYNTGDGLFLGEVGGIPKFSLGNPSGDYITYDGISLNVRANIPKYYTPGSLVVASADTVRDYTQTDIGTSAIPLTKVKEIAMDGAGTVRCAVTADIYNTNTSNPQDTNTLTTYWYKNGSLVAVAGSINRSINIGDPASVAQTYTRDISIESGDSIQVYITVSGPGNYGQAHLRYRISNFRISTSQAPTPTVNLN